MLLVPCFSRPVHVLTTPFYQQTAHAVRAVKAKGDSYGDGKESREDKKVKEMEGKGKGKSSRVRARKRSGVKGGG